MDAVPDDDVDLLRRSGEAQTRAHPGPSPAPATSKRPILLFLIFTLSISVPESLAKEAVIFEQIRQLAGITAYLHVHIELSISSVEAQLVKYHQLLKENCNLEIAVLNYMLTYVNTTISSFTLKRDFPTGPKTFRRSPW
jgi:hypothetical protein